MIYDKINLKSEALLLICRDIIETYENNDKFIYDFGQEFEGKIKEHIGYLKQGLNTFLQPNSYYLRNSNISRIKMILNFHNYLNKKITEHFQNDTKFNPTMLCFSMLAVWFKEFGFESKSKDFLFFSIYPYGEIYDNLLVTIKDEEYKKLNVKMIKIAERIMVSLYKIK